MFCKVLLIVRKTKFEIWMIRRRMLSFQLQEGNSFLSLIMTCRVLDLMNLEIPHLPVPGEDEPVSSPMEAKSEKDSSIPTLPKQQYLSLDKVEYIVVDEADLMLDISSCKNSNPNLIVWILLLKYLRCKKVFLIMYLGFKEQLNTMFSSIPDEKNYQTVCCSATYTDKVCTA